MPGDSLAVLLLIALLDHRSFAVRQSAHAGLADLGDRALPQLVVYPPRSPEQRQRIGRLVQARRPAALARLLARFDPLPSIESLPDDYREGATDSWWVAQCYLLRTGWVDDEERWGCAGWSGERTDACRAATRLLIADLDERGWPLPRIEALLRRMAAPAQKDRR